MSSWVYLFSTFTSEALLFEALIIFVLCGGYAAFWVLHKRKLGALEKEIPAGVVKGYLNELIVDAEQMRAQLFGLLAAHGTQLPAGAIPAQYSVTAAQTGAVAANIPAGSASPEALARLALLEAKMAEQTKAMELILGEKAGLEKALADAKASAANAASGAGADNGYVKELQDKVQLLETKLAEYSVIEDDLANLKRLQQENAQLKASLGQGGATATQPATAQAAPAPAAKEPAAPAPAAATPTAEAAPVSEAFEGMVDQVEQSLKLETETEAAAPAAPAATEEGAAASAPAPASAEKNDADLVAEFEKMLNG